MLFVQDLQIFKLGSSNISSIGSKNTTCIDVLFCTKHSSDKGRLAN